MVTRVTYDGPTQAITLVFRSEGIKNLLRDMRARTKSMKEPSVFEISFRLHDADDPENSCAPRGEPANLARITQVLALAIHFENMLREGEAEDYAHIGRLTGMCRERISQIMRLNYLAPAIQVECCIFHLADRTLPDQRGRGTKDCELTFLGTAAGTLDAAETTQRPSLTPNRRVPNLAIRLDLWGSPEPSMSERSHRASAYELSSGMGRF